MPSPRVRTLVLKSLLALVALSGLAVMAGQALLPTVPLSQVLSWTVLGGLVGMAVLVMVIIVTAQFRQWVLRRGGTDMSWGWFGAEPPGLAQQRAALKQKGPPQ